MFQPFDSLVYFGVGSGEYDELTRVPPSVLLQYIRIRSKLYLVTLALCSPLSHAMPRHELEDRLESKPYRASFAVQIRESVPRCR